jgi:hypothetical protein
MVDHADDPTAVIQRQLDAYNARDIDAFMAAWADDARYYEHPAKLLAGNAAEIRSRHIERFKDPVLHGHLVSRCSVGATVIDHERVTRSFPEGPCEIEVLAIYEVTNGKIRNAWFVFGKPSPLHM